MVSTRQLAFSAKLLYHLYASPLSSLRFPNELEHYSDILNIHL